MPVNPAFASLNLSQAVLVMAYEWFKLAGGGLPFAMPQKSPPATKQQLLAFFANLERELDKVEFFRPPEKRATMLLNLRNIFHRMEPTQQDIQTLHGVILAIADGRKGPARGGLLDSDEALMLRALLAEHDKGKGSGAGGAVRGLSRLLRRNPTDAERALWDALTKDRRFVGSRLQAADADRAACRRPGVVPAAAGGRAGAARRDRGGEEKPRRAPCVARRAKLFGDGIAHRRHRRPISAEALDRIAAALSPSAP